MKNSDTTRLQRFNHMVCFTALVLLLGLIIFALARTALLIGYGDAASWSDMHRVIMSYRIGVVLDLRTVAMALALFFVLGLVASALPARIFRRYFSVYRIVVLVLYTFIIFLSIANYYYYNAFQAHFNHFMFGVLAGQRNAVLLSMWQEYPIIWVLLSVVVAVIVLRYVLRGLQACTAKWHWPVNRWLLVPYVLLVLALYFLACRGAVGHFPAQFFRAEFSDNHLINQATLNAPVALQEAISEYQHGLRAQPVSKAEGVKAYNTYFKKNLSAAEFSWHKLFAHTPVNKRLAAHPPNVVFTQMESMGRNFLLFESPHNRILGALKPHFKQDLVFTHFVSGGNGTAPTIGRFLINSPLPNIFLSSLHNLHFVSSVARPFKQAGYETVFLTAAEIGWNNLAAALPNDDFDHVYGRQAILARYPKAKTETWGVYDEYMFKYAYYLLQQANKAHRPIFIYMNSVTNHPPYTIPSDYHPLPVRVPKGLAQRMHVSQHEAHMMMLTYQYSANALGQFVNRVQASPFGARTIIGASGDHNEHELMPHYTHYQNFALQHEVPFYLHVPKFYRVGWRMDDSRIGSHKDIFPTLYHLALSNATYANFGDNLLSQKKPAFLFGLNPEELVLPAGIIELDAKPMFYPWASAKRLYVGPARQLTPAQREILKRVKAYQYLLYWQIEREAAGHL